MNPILPREFFVPDAEAHVMPDGRLYIYGSLDVSGSSYYCSKEMRCYSTDDMEHWTDHGVIFRNTAEEPGVPWCPDTDLYAPDAIHKDGKYYLYVCGPGGYEGVAVGNSPVGPFSAAEPIVGANGRGIDPAIFVDDDGQAYYFWGQFCLCGGKLADDMKTLIPESIQTEIITEWEHGFHEGASVRKHNGKYYLVYTDISRGKATCMGYAMADHPLGPYRKCGIIVDNVYCDPDSWNNHGSIECFHGQWYVFYHRSSQNSKTNRRVCVEPICFDENGLIAEVGITANGASAPLDAHAETDASCAGRMMGGCWIRPKKTCGEVLYRAGGKHWSADWAEYRWLDFGEGVSRLILCVRGQGKITARTEGLVLGSVSFHEKEFSEVSMDVASVSGIHQLWLMMEGREFAIDWFRFT